MRKLAFLLLLISIKFFAQVNLVSPTDTLVKDPFFTQNNPSSANGEKVQLVHADFTRKSTDKYNGNPYFDGNVRFDHEGSVLTADNIIWYQNDNFVKAIGNVRLQNPDGSVITAEEMEYDGNTQKGIARKNVLLTDPKQTIKTERLYYDKISNQAYFNTGGTISDATSTMYTNSSSYNLNSKKINFSGNVKYNTPDYILEGKNIVQNQITNTAEFSGPTTISSKKDPTNRVYTEKGSYNMNSKEVFLKKNSKIYYKGKILSADNMYYNQITGFGKGKEHVTLYDPKEKRYIKGGYGEIFEKKDSAMITNHPYAVKILENDSLFFSAEKFITFQKTEADQTKKSFLRAFRKARFFKSNAQARADSLSFNETDGIMHLYRKPILWSGDKQITGDTIKAYFDTKKEFIDSLKVLGHAFAISKVDSLNLKDEFHQVKGKLMSVYYKENEINLAKVIGNAQAITYADDQNEKTKKTERIGLSLSTCGTIDALFEDRKVQVISCNIAANVDTYPMSLVPKEKRFLPDFNWNSKDRPRKWQDIFLDSPNYEEIKYESDDELYNKVQQLKDKEQTKEEAKKPKRVKK